MNQQEIPEGIYDGRALRAARDVNPKTGAESVVVELELDVAGEAKTAITNLYTTEKATPFTIEKLLAMGWTEADGADFRNVGKNPVRVAIKYEPYNGVPQRRVNILTGARFDFSGPKGDAAERDFGARMAKAAAQHKAGVAAIGTQPDPWDLEGKKQAGPGPTLKL
jgi:hypothetical protein